MRILFAGDIVGKRGREVLAKHLPSLKAQYEPDFVIVNGENAAHGKGITKKIYNSFVSLGADVITMGNHTFSNDNLLTFIGEADRLVTPANRDPDKPSRPVKYLEYQGKKIAVFNLVGEIFMDPVTESPAAALERLIREYPADLRIVDFHAEATSEKAILLRLFYDQVSLIVGTHTHVQTADECVYKGCAFISDIGMCGGYDSIIGRDTQEILERVKTGKHTHFVPADTPGIFSAVVVDFNDETCRAESIRRIQIRPEEPQPGFRNADKVTFWIDNPSFPGIHTAKDLYEALSGIWCRETCAPRMREEWTPENKTLGQCLVTAFLCQDIFGGEVYGVPLEDGNYHCFNVVEGEVFDLTSEQFAGKDLVYTKAYPQSRKTHFAKEEKRLRYELLRQKLIEKIS